jgi:hypothetical protein
MAQPNDGPKLVVTNATQTYIAFVVIDEQYQGFKNVVEFHYNYGYI